MKSVGFIRNVTWPMAIVKPGWHPILCVQTAALQTKFRAKYISTTRVLKINPLLPFDVLEEVQNDDLAEANEKLKKQKRQLKKRVKQAEEKQKDENEMSEKDEKDENSKSVEVDGTKIVPNDEVTAISTNISNTEVINVTNNLAMGGMGGGNGGDGGKKPPIDEEERRKEDEKKKLEEEEKRKIEEEKKKKGEEEEEKKQAEKEKEEAFEEDEEEKPKSKLKEYMDKLIKFTFKCLETMGITFSSIAILGVAGLLYHKFYRDSVLNKIDEAFQKGDPAFQMTMHKRTNRSSEDWVERPQQALMDDIISGKVMGRYFLVIGEKGTGKTSIILEAMKKVDSFNCAFFDAHADPELFRIRLGRALRFEYHEDYIGSLFSIRGPRDTTALLDIERAFTKLEETALERVKKTKKPLVLVINNAHLIRDDEEGRNLVELLQQKAELLSGSGLVTMILNSDDYWLYERLKKLGTKLEVVNVRDLDRVEATRALQYARKRYFDENIDEELCNKIYDLIGGRPQHIGQVARHKDLITAAHEIIDREKTWFLNQCGLLGMDMDDDVMDSGKFATSAMLLMKEFVKMDRERLKIVSVTDQITKDHLLPELPLWRARQIMTRNDYIQVYDNLNIFTIDSDSKVRADSVPMMRAFHEIASQPGFDDLLEDTCERIGDIESLGRTRELVAKDLVLGGKYKISKASQSDEYRINLQQQVEDEAENGDIMMEDISHNAHKKWWNRRMKVFGESYVPVKVVSKDIDIRIKREKD